MLESAGMKELFCIVLESMNIRYVLSIRGKMHKRVLNAFTEILHMEQTMILIMPLKILK